VGLTIGDKLKKKSLSEEDSTSSSPLPKRQKGGQTTQTLLIVGGAGGVGSWTTLLARAAYPNLEIISTTSTDKSAEWCKKMGAKSTIRHTDIQTSLKGGIAGSVDYIICLTEPTKELFDSLAEVLKPFGTICLVVAGTSIKNLDMSFVFFKSGCVCTETVFSSCRAGFYLDQGDQIRQILDLIAKKKTDDDNNIRTPLMMNSDDIPNWKEALDSNGVFEVLASGHCRGKLVLKIGSE